MTRRFRCTSSYRLRRGFSSETLEPRQLLAAHPVISEFLARNDGLVDDGDGNTPDYIEIYNSGNEAVDLAGYRLTDDPTSLTKWTFPSRMLDPGDFALVYASGQDRDDYVDAGGFLHTNFSLRRSGEYLALVSPDNHVMSEFGSMEEDYPEQLPNVSFGTAQSVTLITPDTPSEYIIPGVTLSDWQAPDFDAAAAGFAEGTMALGLETSNSSRNNFRGHFTTELPEGTTSVYARAPFELVDASTVTNLSLRVKFDDAYIAYLNGVRVASANAPDSLNVFSSAIERHNDGDALEWTEVDLSEHVGLLRQGKNVLALAGLNHLNDRGGMLLAAELSAGAGDLAAVTGKPTQVGYMTTPTPGGPNVSNDEVFGGFVADTKFSVDRGYYESPQTVEITTETTDAQIYYTTDGSAPTPGGATSHLYTGPVDISTTTALRAAAFLDGMIPSNTDTQTYLFLDDVLAQSDDSAKAKGFPDRWGNIQADYEMDQRIIDEFGAESVKQSLLSTPTVSISIQNEQLFGPQGIYTRAESRGAAFERAASVEWLNPDGSEGISDRRRSPHSRRCVPIVWPDQQELTSLAIQR